MTKFQTWMEFQNTAAVEPESQPEVGAGVDDIQIRRMVKIDLHRLFSHLNNVPPAKLAQIVGEIANEFTSNFGLNKGRLMRTVRQAVA
jgi:hypothetical protein